MQNIERSHFRKGQYVGYSGGNVWRITRITARGNKRIGWRAVCQVGSDVQVKSADTLRELSQKLA